MASEGRLVVFPITESEILESEGGQLVFGGAAYAYGGLLRERGEHAPRLDGPNRPSARLPARKRVEAYDARLVSRRRLAAQGSYWSIWRRKLLREAHRIAWRYLKWFVNRVLRLKRVTGRDRRIKRSDLTGFR